MKTLYGGRSNAAKMAFLSSEMLKENQETTAETLWL